MTKCENNPYMGLVDESTMNKYSDVIAKVASDALHEGDYTAAAFYSGFGTAIVMCSTTSEYDDWGESPKEYMLGSYVMFLRSLEKVKKIRSSSFSELLSSLGSLMEDTDDEDDED